MAAMPISSMQWETMAAIVELSDRISALLQPGWSYSLAIFLLRDKIFKTLQKWETDARKILSRNSYNFLFFTNKENFRENDFRAMLLVNKQQRPLVFNIIN